MITARAKKPTRRSLLLVEDSKAMNLLLTSILKNHFNVYSFYDPVAAFAWLKEGNIPDIIVTDYFFRESTGLDFMKSVRMSGFLPNIPAIMVTSAKQEQLPSELILYNVDMMIHKPFEPTVLLTKIYDVLDTVKL